MSEQQAVDYEAVIKDLQARRAAFNAALDTAIASIRQVLALASGIGVFTPQGNGSTTPPAQGDDDGAFLGLTIGDAAKKYLRLARKPLSSREIAAGLEQVGYVHTSKNFINTVNTAMWRAEKAEGDVFRTERGWALLEWAPNRRKPKEKSDEAMSPIEGDVAEIDESGATSGDSPADLPGEEK
jgi:hypothetical protein